MNRVITVNLRKQYEHIYALILLVVLFVYVCLETMQCLRLMVLIVDRVGSSTAHLLLLRDYRVDVFRLSVSPGLPPLMW